ncbi:MULTISPECIES: NAD(P)-dependent oxidoreductase [unclassified Arthrobacter]|uniref:NAD-dependent epimerase/dehydratase family protein n=1 Tax=unclassified Arthrobacter TaxID=235627 RepID=UPI0015E2BA90|nr:MULTISPECIES: NAD-dependent epimerase/dehydratase family protein [unclassified Arthrobacter]
MHKEPAPDHAESRWGTVTNHLPAGGSVRVLLIGAWGFIGSHIRAALESDNKVDVIGMTRRPANEAQAAGTTRVHGDITIEGTLQKALAGVDVVINAASYTGKSPDLADSINRRGPLNLISACRRLGLPLIHMGTTAVYGSGPHRNLPADTAELHPESVVSQARAIADDAVLQAGGVVIRPHMVFGQGDRWFVPTLTKVFQQISGSIDGPDCHLSLIDAEQLGQLVALLATDAQPRQGAFHAAHPSAIRLSQILQWIDQRITPLDLNLKVSREDAVSKMAELGLSGHQIRLISEDHWYDAESIWAATNTKPKPLNLSDSTADWYKSHLKRHLS